MNINLPDQSDAGAMCGPTVTVTSGSDGMSVEVGQEFGRTRLTPEEWAELAVKRGDQPYVVIDFTPDVAPFAGPALSYADAMGDFRHYANARAYGPHTGRSLRVMSQADYLDAREKWSQS